MRDLLKMQGSQKVGKIGDSEERIDGKTDEEINEEEN
jgi:hypothetical protein